MCNSINTLPQWKLSIVSRQGQGRGPSTRSKVMTIMVIQDRVREVMAMVAKQKSHLGIFLQVPQLSNQLIMWTSLRRVLRKISSPLNFIISQEAIGSILKIMPSNLLWEGYCSTCKTILPQPMVSNANI